MNSVFHEKETCHLRFFFVRNVFLLGEFSYPEYKEKRKFEGKLIVFRQTLALFCSN